MNIKVLDCTLRDGGYINNWNFSQFQVHKIIDSLEKSDIDIIELGYLDNKKGAGENSMRFNSVFSVDSVLSSASNNHPKVLKEIERCCDLIQSSGISAGYMSTNVQSIKILNKINYKFIAYLNDAASIKYHFDNVCSQIQKNFS